MPFQPGNKLGKGRPPGSRNKDRSKPFSELDPQSPMASRFRALLVGIVNDLGGEEMISTGQLQLAKRCAWLSTQCEAMERREPFGATTYVAITGRLNQVLRTLGLKRQPRDVTPSLKDYLAAGEGTGGDRRNSVTPGAG
jgi:hypothetical protein